MIAEASSPKRNTGIDLLRGLSILSVILLHVSIRTDFRDTNLGQLLSPEWHAFLFRSGYYGVALFFVLSGYLITNSALTKWGALTTIRVREFYWMRFARIIPLLLLLLIVLSALHLFGVPGFRINPETATLGRSIVAALTFHVNWLEIKAGYLPAGWDILWSLSIEEVFYLLFPLVCVTVRREWHFAALIAVFFMISPWARVAMYPGNELGDRNHLAYIDGIAMGCITALIANRFRFDKRVLQVLLVVGIGLLVFVFYFRSAVFQLGLTSSGLYISVLSLGVSFVVIWMHRRHADGLQRSSASLRWLEQLGQYSYEIYLTHALVVIACVATYQSLGLSGAWAYALYSAVVAMSYFLGRLVARAFSDPVNRWLRAGWGIPRAQRLPVRSERSSGRYSGLP